MDMKIIDSIKGTFTNIMPFGILLLAASIVFFAMALFGFTNEVSKVRRDLPRALDRIDIQIGAVKVIMGSAEVSGQNFSSAINRDISSGINKGITSGVMDVPLTAVANVGYKITDTTNAAAMQFTNFWEGLKNRLTYKPREKSSPTAEAAPKK